MSKNIFFIGMILAASGLLSPPIALAAGLVYGLSFAHPFHLESRKLSRLLLQVSVVALGFGMNLRDVLHAGASGFFYTAISITAALSLGWLLGRVFRVHQRAAFLISAGTAICGGSAIAALAPIVAASEEEIAIALGAVFTLNSVALVAFPPIGQALHLSQTQFGLWAALAIHDTSSVVGAAARYGSLALAIGTTVKLARALWIVPLSLVSATLENRNHSTRAKIQWPWFILFFVLAAVVNTTLPALKPAFDLGKHLGIIGLTVTLFLIGTSLNRKTIQTVGPRPLLQAILLWIVVASASLALILSGWISL